MPRTKSNQAAVDNNGIGGASFFKKKEIWLWFFLVFIQTQPFGSVLFANSHLYNWICELLGAAALLFLIPETRGRNYYLKMIWPFYAYLFYCVLISVVNPDAMESLKTLAVFVLSAAPAMVMALRLRPLDYCRVVASVLVVGCVLSLLVALFMPSIGLTPSTTEAGIFDVGGWKGIYPHKNHLGHLAGFTCGSLLFAGRGLFRDVRIWAVAVLVAAICVYGSKSSTATILVAAIPSFYLAVAKPRGLARYFSIFFVALFFFGALVFRDEIVHLVLGMLGKNSSLSGRTDIWLHAEDLIAQHPLFGGGFAFSSSDAYHAALMERFQVPYTHNQYLDIVLNAGVIGLAVYMAMVGYAVWQSWRRRASDTTAYARNFLTLLLVGVIISGWSEGYGPVIDQVFVLAFFGLLGSAVGEARGTRASHTKKARSRADVSSPASGGTEPGRPLRTSRIARGGAQCA